MGSGPPVMQSAPIQPVPRQQRPQLPIGVKPMSDREETCHSSPLLYSVAAGRDTDQATSDFENGPASDRQCLYPEHWIAGAVVSLAGIIGIAGWLSLMS